MIVTFMMLWVVVCTLQAYDAFDNAERP